MDKKTREIKFRYVFKGWDSGIIITEIFNIQQIEDGEVEDFVFSEESELGERLKLIDRNLYTVFKDKNGKEIYEGDILKEILNDWEQVFVSEVVFVDGCFKTRTKDKRFKEYSYIDHTESTMEVIGNIYENPELLEENE